MSLPYDQFLSRATSLFLSNGAQQLLPDGSLSGRPDWAEGWDQILLADHPGSRSIYAFAQARDPSSFRSRVDALARGIATSGVLAGPPVRLVVVATLPDGMEVSQRRLVARSAPSTYYPGLRPSIWTVDLESRAVHAPRLTSSEGSGLLARALEEAPDGDIVDPGGVSELQRRNMRRQHDFYELMRSRQPVVTYGLIAVNVAVFLFLYTRGGPSDERTLRDLGAMSPALVEHGEWWRLCTSMFLHASVAHILFNMTSLFAVGTLAERLYGSARLLAIYLGAGLIGSLASFGYAVTSGNTDVLGVGASGAIFGVAAALITVRFHPSEVIPQRLRDRISTSILPLVLISLVVAFLTPHVDNAAHVGGLLGGAALSFAFPLTRSAQQDASTETMAE